MTYRYINSCQLRNRFGTEIEEFVCIVWGESSGWGSFDRFGVRRRAERWKLTDMRTEVWVRGDSLAIHRRIWGGKKEGRRVLYWNKCRGPDRGLRTGLRKRSRTVRHFFWLLRWQLFTRKHWRCSWTLALHCIKRWQLHDKTFVIYRIPFYITTVDKIKTFWIHFMASNSIRSKVSTLSGISTNFMKENYLYLYKFVFTWATYWQWNETNTRYCARSCCKHTSVTRLYKYLENICLTDQIEETAHGRTLATQGNQRTLYQYAGREFM